MNKLLPIGTKVNHTGHGAGVVFSYNGKQKNEHIEQNYGTMEVQSVLIQAIVDSFYSGDKYPYIIQFDSGYKDVYTHDDVTEVK